MIILLIGLKYLSSQQAAIACDLPSEHFQNLPPDGLDDCRNDRVAELAVRLCVGNDDFVLVIEPHEPCGFSRGQTSRIPAVLRDEDFRPILVVPRA